MKTMALDIAKLPEEARKALSQFPEFEPREFNDSGANAYVLIGRHRVLRKKVAIKIYFHEENEVDEEPAILSKISHPNVLKVYDARKVEKDCSYFLMPAADEGDLSNFLNKYHISTHLAHTLLCQLLSGISALHASPNNLVHRDLKPENLLVNNDNILIADFGSIRRVSDDTGKAPASKHSILFRPPEAFGDGAFFDYSSDVYQSGLIGYLLFGGQLSNDLLTYLNKKEISRVKCIEAKGDAFKTSCFIDGCLEKKIARLKLADLSSLPFYIHRRLALILKRSVCAYCSRYKTTSEFLSELMKIRGNLPDWIKDDEGFCLRNWNGNDYFLYKDRKQVRLKKKKTSSSGYRRVRSISEDSFENAYLVLKKELSLP